MVRKGAEKALLSLWKWTAHLWFQLLASHLFSLPFESMVMQRRSSLKREHGQCVVQSERSSLCGFITVRSPLRFQHRALGQWEAEI